MIVFPERLVAVHGSLLPCQFDISVSETLKQQPVLQSQSLMRRERQDSMLNFAQMYVLRVLSSFCVHRNTSSITPATALSENW